MITEREARWKIKKALEQREFLFKSATPDTYSGQLTVGHLKLDVIIKVPDARFVKLPTIEITNRLELPIDIIAHLEIGNGLCYADKQLLRLDPLNPDGSILRVLEEAENTIMRSLAGGAKKEIMGEYVNYWAVTGCTNVQILIPPSINVSAAILGIPTKQSKFKAIILVAKPSDLPDGYEIGRDVYIVNISGNLKPHDKLVAPHTLEDFKNWYLKQLSSPPVSFEKLLAQLVRKKLVFLKASNGWVGLRIELPANLNVLSQKQNPNEKLIASQLLKDSSKIKLKKYIGLKSSLSDIVGRNLQTQSTSFEGKRIALVGCGTIGSYLARFLVQTGAGCDGELILIDNDVISSGNLGRHLLNFADVGKRKSIALAQELSHFHPNLVVKPIYADCIKSWHKYKSADLIIDATGVEVVSDFFNEKVLENLNSDHTVNVLHTWIYGNGISVQTFLNVGENFACYRCLRPELDKPWIGDPRKNVKREPDIRNLGCGTSPYTPYSVSASVNAASLALDAASDFLSGNVGHRLRTRLLSRSQGKQVMDKSPPKHKRCPACGN